MTDASEPKPWIRAKIEALLRSEWIGKAGNLFRKTAESIEAFNDQHAHIQEKLQQAPDVAWKSAQIKSSQTDLNLAQAEERRIATVLAERTLEAKTRQEEAAAGLAETRTRMAQTEEIQGRLKLAQDLRAANCIPRWDANGNMTVIPAPPDYDWDAMTKGLLQAQAPTVAGFIVEQTK
jgi:hypothetical protein